MHPEVVKRMNAAKDLGVKVLKAVPRIGAYDINDPDGSYYLQHQSQNELSEWITRIHNVARQVEARGVGMAQVKAIGERLGVAEPEKLWFETLELADNVHDQREVERAFSEWADGDSLASHIAYGLDIFCTNDVGKTGEKQSILDQVNRDWLTKQFGVIFMTIDELAEHLNLDE